jgi:predicted transcriptional regulator
LLLASSSAELILLTGANIVTHDQPSILPASLSATACGRGLWPALTLSVCTVLALAPGVARAEIQVGATIENVTIQDANKQPTQIPNLGKKVLLLLYTDPDVADQNDPFGDQAKASNLDQTYFQSIGIANLEDAPAKPNWIIRVIMRGKIKKYDVTILADPDRSLVKAWDLGDCNNKSVVLLVGKDKKLKYFKKGAISVVKDPATGKSEADQLIDLIKQQIAEAKGG